MQIQAMIAGTIALAHSVVACIRAKLRAVTATLLSLVVWLIVAFGLLIFAGGQTCPRSAFRRHLSRKAG
jgi:hypothetical protein